MTNPHRIIGTFDVKPTTAPASAKPDELMIDWTTLQPGSTASIYLPSASSKDIQTMAAAIHGYQPFGVVDAHTISCPAQGISYVPVPRVSGNLAGLIDVVLPSNVKIGDKLTVAVTQLANQSANLPIVTVPSTTSIAVARPTKQTTWRKASGTFQLALKVKTTSETLPIVERNLSILRWIFETIPQDSRWRPVFARYLDALANQITALGGNPAKIPASDSGLWPKNDYSDGAGCIIGKITGLIFDHFGDFEGFILETECEEKFQFFSREKNMQSVAERCWAERLRVTVVPEEQNEHHPGRIILHPAPAPFKM
jgi:hypothetical protein